jgi:dipeptidyl-peptidase-4
MLYVYGGPHAQLVNNEWLGGASLFDYFMAQNGYIVFTLDNRGSDARGKYFEHIVHRKLGQNEMQDQMKGIDYLTSKSFVDKDKIGVYGWSFGGFMTISLMLNHNDIFKVGVAGGPVCDWKYYEVMYGERYMDTPQENPQGYEQTSVINKAKNLNGKLLVIHGAQDPVVVQQNSMNFIQACIENGKQVDYFLYPTHEHNVRGKDRVHLNQKIFQYFETYLK